MIFNYSIVLCFIPCVTDIKAISKLKSNFNNIRKVEYKQVEHIIRENSLEKDFKIQLF